MGEWTCVSIKLGGKITEARFWKKELPKLEIVEEKA